MDFYVVYNCYECYNIFSTEEKAIEAVKILRERHEEYVSEKYEIFSLKDKPITILPRFEEIDEEIYIFKVKEGEAFGTELNSDSSTQDVYLAQE